MRVPLKYICEDVDRHGNVRCYVRAPGKRKVRLRALLGTPEFMEEYQAAIATAVEAPLRQADEAKRGSFRHLCIRYYSSAAYKALDVSTRNWQRRALDEIGQEHGAKQVATMQAGHVRRLRDAKAETPAAANQRVKALRALFSWANEADETTVNPTIGVKKLQYRSEGHHTWSDEEIQQYYARHPIGTQARLALDLLRYTAGRREDAPRFGRQHIRNGRFQFRQAKNEDRNPIEIDIPLHPALAQSIAATRAGNMTFLITEYGKPFTANGFGNKFKDWCRQANLPHCSAHGVRKATSTELAESSATPHEIMAVTGHQTLEEVDRHTKAASRKKTADRAMAKLR
ncbi:tyrosine-type recombinase/integrase [Bradyrhizobium canariense]|uniref:tyrosine-type recombinase/integrase n=1 Tax=Bradyrhizobium canariense TaxID=255045 RepID=UPI000A18E084|nr:tyrosine-type recombinase/integrase [Bradyrhizobium canariense]OSI33025.1 integrase [Bradyrhizobium canariense]OSI36967.1 integrase [Bradyrhizobium canariense]OSI53463.1 integrase [Bradyrhizobium canariense]OSI56697.1 integrase [Bradyrhizobium canariense]OSI59091.1 integrase [Bradyrhizobium canariense]